MRLKDKVAVVTGSGSGMGKAIAHRLAEEGATIVVADISQAGIDATVAELTTRGAKALGMKMDVSNRDDTQRAMQEIIARAQLPVTVVDERGAPELAGDYPYNLHEGKHHLLLCRHRGAFFKPCPGTRLRSR